MVSQRIKQSTQRKKRRFSGNKWTRLRGQAASESATSQDDVADVLPAGDIGAEPQELVEMEVEQTASKKTASESKLVEIQTVTPSKKGLPVTGNRIMDMEILSNVFASLNCPNCSAGELKLRESYNNKKGLASLLQIACSSCDFEKQFYTSKEHRQVDQGEGAKGFDINKRIAYALRSIGKGYASLEKLMAVLDMPHPMTRMNYNKISKALRLAITQVAKETMSDAAKEIIENNDPNTDTGAVDVAVSLDGAWQKRVFEW